MSTAQSRVFDAPLESKGPVPAYKVVEVKGPHPREVVKFDERTKTLIRETIQEPVKYMVYFPRGHAIAKWSLEELEAAGFGEVVPLIKSDDMDEVNEAARQTQTIPRVIEKQENKK